MSKDREEIKESVKRKVRRRCGFGCVICGKPFYDYDHIEEYSKVQEHEASNLTLLCPDHHAEKTRGLRSSAQIRAADANPFNKRNGLSGPYVLAYEGSISKVSIGSNLFIQSIGPNYGEPLVLNGEPMVKVRTEDGNLLVSAKLSDASGGIILTIEENELRYDTNLWDVEFIAGRLVVRKARGEIVSKIVFSPPDAITVERAYFSHEGITVRVTPREIMYETRQGERTSFRDNEILDFPYPCGIVITDTSRTQDSLSAAFYFTV
ncbi:HNH endonuclease [Streptomyces sp. NPDC088560]|uniref:HNH endonuclease n=1 Tax=Streptomyces sp. NPDC088560 TaxID=3365868 RepID=UPI0037FFFB86